MMEDGHHPVRVLDEAAISDDDKVKIYETNARRVFNLKVG
jgi:predicted TIM-barrel fold metal-dependent hydrolase